jgi:hypothetical protein
MDRLHALEAALEKIVLDPKYHDILTLVKGVRNGIVYGSKVRFPHALVYVPQSPSSLHPPVPKT